MSQALGLRERKKLQTRQLITDAARRLFAAGTFTDRNRHGSLPPPGKDMGGGRQASFGEPSRGPSSGCILSITPVIECAFSVMMM